MVERDYGDILRVVTELTASSKTYATHFTLWLGLGSAGGAVAMLSFVANLPDPDYALHALLPAFGAFALGVICSGASVLMASLRDGAGAEHHGHAFNREQLNTALRQTPQWFSSAPAQAERMNAGRDKMVQENKAEHEQAEKTWQLRTFWSRAYLITTAAAALLFVIGITWPLTLVASGGTLKPKPPTPIAAQHAPAAAKPAQLKATPPVAQGVVTQETAHTVTQTAKVNPEIH